jgi:PAS domain-containing protein
MGVAQQPDASGDHIEVGASETKMVSRRAQTPHRGKFKQLPFSFAGWVATLSARSVLRLYAGARKIGRQAQYVRGRLVDFGYLLRTSQSRVQEALRRRETELAKVVYDSCEPVVVTDDAHRILAVNSAALGLLGVSKANFNKFTIDAFLAPQQIHCFERRGRRFVKSQERVGECEIRPLGGNPKVVEFSFQANFILGRHVSKFRDVA